MPLIHLEDHAVRVMKLVGEMYKNSVLTDTVLDTTGGLIHGHKTILAACSPYLKKLFMDNVGVKIIPFEEVKYDDMRLIFDFVYYGEVDVPVSDVASLMDTAELLQISSLKCPSLNFSDKFSIKDTCEGSVGNSELMCDRNSMKNVNREYYPENLLQEGRLYCSGRNLNPQLVNVPKTKVLNLSKKLRERAMNDESKMSLTNSSVHRSEECSQEEPIPFTFVAVKSEGLDNQGGSDSPASDFLSEKPLEEYPDNCDVNQEMSEKEERNCSSLSQEEMTTTVEAFRIARESTGKSSEQENEVTNSSQDLKPSSSSHCDAVFSSETKYDHLVSKYRDQFSLYPSHCMDGNALSEFAPSRGADVRNFSCNVCAASFSLADTLKKHMESHSDEEKSYVCDVCGNVFDRKLFLKEHKMEHLSHHAGEKPYSCSVCPASFKRRYHLKEHTRTHTGEKPFSCSLCESSFSQSYHLKQHMQTHTGEKPFACVTCRASFSRKDQLRLHVQNHTGDKPFSCTTCRASFSRKYSLEVHLRRHTGEKPFPCETCGVTFGHKNSLTAHMRTHTGEKPFTCGICEASFTQSGHLKRHELTHAGDAHFA